MLKLASSSWDEKEIAAIKRVIQSDNYSMGKEVKEFEEVFAEYIGSKYSVMVNSGSSANLLAVACLMYRGDERRRLKRDDEIIVPAVSWSTSYFPFQQFGMKLKFVDIDKKTLNYNMMDLKSSISEKTRQY